MTLKLNRVRAVVKIHVQLFMQNIIKLMSYCANKLFALSRNGKTSENPVR